MRGETSLLMMKFGAWGVDWSHPSQDNSKPNIADVEIAFSPVMGHGGAAGPMQVGSSAGMPTSSLAAGGLQSVWLQGSAFTDEPTKVLVRVQGLSNTQTGQKRDPAFAIKHILRLDLMELGLLGDSAKIQLWAVDRAENLAHWGPFTFEVFSREVFEQGMPPQSRRLSIFGPSTEEKLQISMVV